MSLLNEGCTRVYTDDGRVWRVSESAVEIAHKIVGAELNDALGLMLSDPGHGGSIGIMTARIVAIVDEPDEGVGDER